MGKTRIKTIGIEEEENKEKKKLKERNDAKKAEAAKRKLDAEKSTSETGSPITAEKPAEEKSTKPKTSKYKEKNKKSRRSKSYKTATAKLEKGKKYTLKEALTLLSGLKRAKYDETVELHVNTTDKGVAGQVTLKHGTGKTRKIEIADEKNDPKGVETLVKKITDGQIDFDVLIATPESMPHLAPVARFLGPRGLMPSPKSGTVHPRPEEARKNFEGGQINFKTEAKAPIIHLSVGKMSFGETKLEENIKDVLMAVQSKNIKNVTLKSTISPGIKLQA